MYDLWDINQIDMYLCYLIKEIDFVIHPLYI